MSKNYRENTPGLINYRRLIKFCKLNAMPVFVVRSQHDLSSNCIDMFAENVELTEGDDRMFSHFSLQAIEYLQGVAIDVMNDIIEEIEILGFTVRLSDIKTNLLTRLEALDQNFSYRLYCTLFLEKEKEHYYCEHRLMDDFTLFGKKKKRPGGPFHFEKTQLSIGGEFDFSKSGMLSFRVLSGPYYIKLSYIFRLSTCLPFALAYYRTYSWKSSPMIIMHKLQTNLSMIKMIHTIVKREGERYSLRGQCRYSFMDYLTTHRLMSMWELQKQNVIYARSREKIFGKKKRRPGGDHFLASKLSRDEARGMPGCVLVKNIETVHWIHYNTFIRVDEPRGYRLMVYTIDQDLPYVVHYTDIYSDRLFELDHDFVKQTTYEGFQNKDLDRFRTKIDRRNEKGNNNNANQKPDDKSGSSRSKAYTNNKNNRVKQNKQTRGRNFNPKKQRVWKVKNNKQSNKSILNKKKNNFRELRGKSTSELSNAYKILCFCCGAEGHKSFDCPENTEGKVYQRPKQSKYRIKNDLSDKSFDPELFVSKSEGKEYSIPESKLIPISDEFKSKPTGPIKSTGPKGPSSGPKPPPPPEGDDSAKLPMIEPSDFSANLPGWQYSAIVDKGSELFDLANYSLNSMITQFFFNRFISLTKINVFTDATIYRFVFKHFLSRLLTKTPKVVNVKYTVLCKQSDSVTIRDTRTDYQSKTDLLHPDAIYYHTLVRVSNVDYPRLLEWLGLEAAAINILRKYSDSFHFLLTLLLRKINPNMYQNELLSGILKIFGAEVQLLPIEHMFQVASSDVLSLAANDQEIWSKVNRSVNATNTVNINKIDILSGNNPGHNTVYATYVLNKSLQSKPVFQQKPLYDVRPEGLLSDTELQRFNYLNSKPSNLLSLLPSRKQILLYIGSYLLFSLGLIYVLNVQYLTQLMPNQLLPEFASGVLPLHLNQILCTCKGLLILPVNFVVDIFRQYILVQLKTLLDGSKLKIIHLSENLNYSQNFITSKIQGLSNISILKHSSKMNHMMSISTLEEFIRARMNSKH